jgi:hypothetical protein
MSYLIPSIMMLLLACNRPEPADMPQVAEQPAIQEFDSPSKLVASMTKYRVGVLWKGPKWSDHSQDAIAERVRATADTWKQSVVDGKLVGAVKVENPVDLWGLLFFKTESMDEMKALASNSPLVKEGILAGEVLDVWGTRGLGAGLAETLKENKDAPLESSTHYMAIYRKGENWSEKSDDPSTREATAEGMQYLFELYKDGTLKYYAAVEDMTRPARGMAIIKASSQAEAEAAAAKGPMVVKKWHTVEVLPVSILGGVLP